MFFLLRMTFWLGLVLILLPIGSAQRSPSGGDVSATEAISAASATVGDLRSSADANPTLVPSAHKWRPRSAIAPRPARRCSTSR